MSHQRFWLGWISNGRDADRLGQRDVVPLVVGRGVAEVDVGQRVRLEDVRRSASGRARTRSLPSLLLGRCGQGTSTHIDCACNDLVGTLSGDGLSPRNHSRADPRARARGARRVARAAAGPQRTREGARRGAARRPRAAAHLLRGPDQPAGRTRPPAPDGRARRRRAALPLRDDAARRPARARRVCSSATPAPTTAAARYAVLTDKGDALLLHARRTHLDGVRDRFLRHFEPDELRSSPSSGTGYSRAPQDLSPPD